MRRPISVRKFYQVHQPHGDKGYLYVQDTLRGNGTREIEKVSHEGTSYFIHIDGMKISADYKELYVDKVRGVPDIFSDLFDWYLDGEFKHDLIGYETTLREHFEDEYESRKISISATLERLRNATDKLKGDSILAKRAEVVHDLSVVMGRIDDGDYDIALEEIYAIANVMKDLQKESKKWTGL